MWRDDVIPGFCKNRAIREDMFRGTTLHNDGFQENFWGGSRSSACYLLFVVPLPKQRRWAFLHDHFSWSQTDTTGHSRAPLFSFSPGVDPVWSWNSARRAAGLQALTSFGNVVAGEMGKLGFAGYFKLSAQSLVSWSRALAWNHIVVLECSQDAVG